MDVGHCPKSHDYCSNVENASASTSQSREKTQIKRREGKKRGREGEGGG